MPGLTRRSGENWLVSSWSWSQPPPSETLTGSLWDPQCSHLAPSLNSSLSTEATAAQLGAQDSLLPGFTCEHVLSTYCMPVLCLSPEIWG